MIESVVGLMSSGKTLYMTYKLYIAWLKGKTIITNYPVNFPHLRINQDWLLELVQNDDIVIENVAFGFDELWMWLMDSRRSMGNEAKVGSYFFLQSSKDDSEIYITAQDNTQNDRRLRDNLHRITECKRVLLIDDKFISIGEENRFLERKYGEWINDYLFIEAQTYKRVLTMGVLDLKLTEKMHIPAKLIFNLYDTSKKIKPKMKNV